MIPVTNDSDIVRVVASLSPGECITVYPYEIAEQLPGFWHNGAFFSPADRVLENIVGSGVEFKYSVNPMDGNVTFCRLSKPVDYSRPSYVSPDRRK